MTWFLRDRQRRRIRGGVGGRGKPKIYVTGRSTKNQTRDPIGRKQKAPAAQRPGKNKTTMETPSPCKKIKNKVPSSTPEEPRKFFSHFISLLHSLSNQRATSSSTAALSIERGRIKEDNKQTQETGKQENQYISFKNAFSDAAWPSVPVVILVVPFKTFRAFSLIDTKEKKKKKNQGEHKKMFRKGGHFSSAPHARGKDGEPWCLPPIALFLHTQAINSFNSSSQKIEETILNLHRDPTHHFLKTCPPPRQLQMNIRST